MRELERYTENENKRERKRGKERYADRKGRPTIVFVACQIIPAVGSTSVNNLCRVIQMQCDVRVLHDCCSV